MRGSLLRDDLDERIVAALVENARLSYAQIGDRVGLSAPAVKRRVDRLRTSGVIRGYTAIIEPTALGRGTEAFVQLYCNRKTDPNVIQELVSRFPEVAAAYTVSGDPDAIIHLRARDTSELEEILERIRADRSVDRTRSLIVLLRLLESR